MSGTAPSPMPTPDLAGILRRPPRTATRSPADASPPVAGGAGDGAAAEPPSESGSAVEATVARNRGRQPAGRTLRNPRSAEVSRPAAGKQYLRSIAVYLPRSLHRQVRDAAAEQDTTATALILSAVNSTHGQLAAALAEAAEAEGPECGELFDVPQARRVLEPTVQTTIRVTDSQHRALGQLATDHGVNRSQLIATALRLHLPVETTG